MKSIFTFLLVIKTVLAFSQTMTIPKLVPDGPITKMEYNPGIGLVMSGYFRYVGYPAKNMAIVDNKEGKPAGRFPFLTVTNSPLSHSQREVIPDQMGGWYVVTHGNTSMYNSFQERPQQIWYDSTGKQYITDCISHIKADFSIDTLFNVNRNQKYRITNVMRVVLDNNILYAWCYIANSDGFNYQRKLLGINAQTGAIEWDPNTNHKLNSQTDAIGGMCKVGRKLFIVSLIDTVNGQASSRSSLCYDLNTKQITDWNPLNSYRCNNCPGPTSITGNKNKLIIQIRTSYDALMDLIATDTISTTLWHKSIPKATGTNIAINDTIGYYHSVPPSAISGDIHKFRLSDGQVTQIIPYASRSPSELDTLSINVGSLLGMQLHGKHLYIYGMSSDGINLRRSVVQIDITNSKATQWKPFNEKSPEEVAGANRIVGAMAFQNNNVFLLGEFQLIRLQYAPFLAVINPITNALSWRPKATYGELVYPGIQTFEIEGDSLIWVSYGNNGTSSKLAAFDAHSGFKIRELPVSIMGSTVNVSQIIPTHDRVYIRGTFNQFVSGHHPNISFVAPISKTGEALPWEYAIENGYIYKMLLQGDKLYLGGNFTAKNGSKSMAIINRYTGALINWKSGIDYAYNYITSDFFLQANELFITGPTFDYRKLSLINGKQTANYSYNYCGWPKNMFPIDKYIFINEDHCNIQNRDNLFYFDQSINKFSQKPLLKSYNLPLAIYNYIAFPTPTSLCLFDKTIYYASNYVLNAGGINQPVGLPFLMGITFPNNFFPDKVSYFPQSGGNAGNVTVNFYNNKIAFGSRVELTRIGQTSISVNDSLLTFSEPFRMQAVFNLRGKALGTWDIEITTSTGERIIIPNGFTINQAKPADIHVSINAPAGFRPGGITKAIITVTNHGDTDAGTTICTIPVSPNVTISITKGQELTLVPVDNINGESFNGNAGMLTVPEIGAGQTVDIPLILQSKGQDPIDLRAIPSKVISDTNPTSNSGNFNDIVPCLKVVDDLMHKLAEDVLSNVPLGCSSGVVQSVLGTALSKLAGLDLTKAFQDAALDCLPDIGDAGTITKVVNTAATALSIGQGLIPYAQLASELDKKCKNFQPDPKKQQGAKIPSIQAHDPNDKLGPVGVKLERYVTGIDPFTYLIRFENDSTATADAQIVRIIDTLDREKFDYNTLQLGYFNVADTVFYIPPGKKQYAFDWDLRPGKNLVLRMEAVFNDTTGIVTSTYIALDPKTRELTEDVFLGFLPPNRVAPQGEGGLAFSVKPKQDLPSLTTITNKAYIYFDYNEVVPTPPWSNKLDKGIPSSQIQSLPAVSQDTTITLHWGGSDNANESGVKFYDIMVSVNNHPYKPFLITTPLTSVNFVGKIDSTYRFYSIAYDSVYNEEPAPVTFDAQTRIQLSGTVISVKSGDWNNPATWSCNCIPTVSSNVLIKSGHAVKLTPAMGAQGSKNLTIEAGAIFDAKGVFLADPKR